VRHGFTEGVVPKRRQVFNVIHAGFKKSVKPGRSTQISPAGGR
jgi:hypothetical protein